MKGNQVLGQYPEDITDAGPLTLGRGAFSFFIACLRSSCLALIYSLQ